MCTSGFFFYDKNDELYSRLPHVYYYVPVQLATYNKSIHENLLKKMHSYILYSRTSQQKQKNLQK